MSGRGLNTSLFKVRHHFVQGKKHHYHFPNGPLGSHICECTCEWVCLPCTDIFISIACSYGQESCRFVHSVQMCNFWLLQKRPFYCIYSLIRPLYCIHSCRRPLQCIYRPLYCINKPLYSIYRPLYYIYRPRALTTALYLDTYTACIPTLNIFMKYI